MEETPNLIYLNQLSDGDNAAKKSLLKVLKAEFITEVEQYNINMINNCLLNAAENVHKIRHKIGFLGMEKAYELSNNHEQELKNNSILLKFEFENILNIIHNFLTTL